MWGVYGGVRGMINLNIMINNKLFFNVSINKMYIFSKIFIT